MATIAKKTETETDDGKVEYRVKGGKFSVGRGIEKVKKVAGDIVSLTPLQAKNFADVMEKVNPAAEKASVAETKSA